MASWRTMDVKETMKKNIAKKYRPYPAYRDSGVEWIGEIPEGWEIVRSKALFSHRNQKATSGEEQLTASQVYGVIPQSLFMEKEGRRVVQVITGQDILKHVEAGDFVISMRSFQGGIELSEYTGSISSAYVVLKPSQNVVQQYYSYLLKSTQYIQALQSTSNLVRDGQALRFQNFSQVDLPVVPIEDQQVIASFLDYETAKIDTLLAKYQRLLDLLEEKRSALISRAVTKGLDSNVPMKDSRVGWLGEIPEGWEITKLKYLAPLQSGYAFKSELFQNDGIPIIKMSNLKRGSLDFTEATFIPADKCNRDFALNDGDILLGMSGSLGETGSVGNYAVVNRKDTPCQLNQRVGRFRLTSALFPGFLLYFISSDSFSKPIMLDSIGTAQFNISPEYIGTISLGLPNQSEQRKVVSYLNRETAKIDALVAKVERAVELLKEYRIALISAAVTGKIDLREESA